MAPDIHEDASATVRDPKLGRREVGSSSHGGGGDALGSTPDLILGEAPLERDDDVKPF